MADDRPNVVWIIADDLSPDLGCYGYEGVETANIDRLAEQGVRYTAAFATSPACSPSRSALITGVYQTTIGAHQHRTSNKRPLPEPVEPATELLRRAGYFEWWKIRLSCGVFPCQSTRPVCPPIIRSPSPERRGKRRY